MPAARILTSLLLLLAACSRSAPGPEEEARALQIDLHRAFIETRALGRFGELGLFEQEMEHLPCQPPLSEVNRECEVSLAGRGLVRLRVADADLERSGQLRKDALVSVEYQLDCANARFDFKTLDQVLRRGPTLDGITVWEDKLVRATYRRMPATPRDRCSLTIEAAPALLDRVRAVGRLAPTR